VSAPSSSPTCQTPSCNSAVVVVPSPQCIYTSSGSCSSTGLPCGTLGTYTTTWTKSPDSAANCVGYAPQTTTKSASELCTATPCSPCSYSAWSPTSTPASVTGCKMGSQTISRTATNNGANDCTGPVSSSVPVGISDTSKCSPCSYSAWSPTSTPASVTGCKMGSQTISRTATNNGANDCTGPVSSSVPVGISDTSKCSPCSYGTIDTSSLTPCSVPCGGGTQSGSLFVLNNNGNSSCSPMTSTQSCNTQSCPPPIRHHSIPPPVGRLTPVFSDFSIPKYRIRTPAPASKASTSAPNNYYMDNTVPNDTYAPFAPASSVSYSSCQTDKNLLDNDNLDKFKTLILSAVDNYQRNTNCNT
jgi:hypothetical protein